MVEQSIIGAILRDPDYCKKYVLGINPEYFDNSTNREIFNAILSLYQNDLFPDLIAVAHYLKENDKLTVLDNLIEASETNYSLPSSAYIKSHIRILVSDFIKRQNVLLGKELEIESDEPNVLKKKYEDKIINAEILIKTDEIKNIVELCGNEFLSKVDSREAPKYLETKYTDIDNIVGGIFETDFWIIASRTGIGKTTLALNIAQNISSNGVPVCFISLEMGKEQIFEKMVCAQSRINYDNIINNKLSNNEISKVSNSIAKLYKYPVYINDSTGGNIVNILNYLINLKKEKDVKLIVIDYLQLLISDNGKENRNNELSEISRLIKTFSLEYRTPIIGLAQLNRQIETRTNKIPTLADLKDCGSLEQDADRVLFISRQQDYEKSPGDDYEPAKIYIAKNRHGKTAQVMLKFFGEYQKFEGFSNKTEQIEKPKKELPF